MAKGFCTSDTEKLAAAICSLAQAIDESSKARKCEFDWLKSHLLFATKQDLKEMECRIMSVISDHITKQKAFNERQGAAIDSIVESISGPTGLTSDIKALNDKITELQNSSGGVTPEDQVLINEIEAQGEAVAAKAESAASALKALDQQTPPTPPPA